jgi:hypothetical protein
MRPRRARSAPRSRAVLAFVALVSGAFAVGATPSWSHIVSNREITILLGLPAGWTQALFASPDSLGLAGANRPRWRHVAHQGESIPRFIDACARGDSAGAEIAWRAIDAALARQRPAGDYEAAEPESRLDQLTRTSAWIGDLCRAEVVVMNSPLQKRFQWRVTLMRPKLRRSIDWLVAAGEELLRLHAGRSDLLLVDAEAFLLADGIYHEPRFAELGQRALASGLEGERKVGAVRAIDAEARTLGALSEIATYFPMPMLDEAARRAAQRLERQVARPLRAPAGQRGDDTTRSEALMALACQASRIADRDLLDRAVRLASAARKKSGSR